MAMPDLAELTPSRLLLLFNAWEHPGAHLLEIFLDVVTKGGSDAVIGLGFEVYVAETHRTSDALEADFAWAVANDLIDVVFEDADRAELTVLPPDQLQWLFKSEGSDTSIHTAIRIWLTEQGVEFWRAAASHFPLTDMSIGKTRLIEASRNPVFDTALGLLRWVPEHPGLSERLHLRLWKTRPRKNLVRSEGEKVAYMRVTNTDLRIMDGGHAWGTPDLRSTNFTREESLGDSVSREGFRFARIPMFGHWIFDRKDILAWTRPNECRSMLSQ